MRVFVLMGMIVIVLVIMISMVVVMLVFVVGMVVGIKNAVKFFRSNVFLLNCNHFLYGLNYSTVERNIKHTVAIIVLPQLFIRESFNGSLVGVVHTVLCKQVVGISQ